MCVCACLFLSRMCALFLFVQTMFAPLSFVAVPPRCSVHRLRFPNVNFIFQQSLAESRHVHFAFLKVKLCVRANLSLFHRRVDDFRYRNTPRDINILLACAESKDHTVFVLCTITRDFPPSFGFVCFAQTPRVPSVAAPPFEYRNKNHPRNNTSSRR